MAGGRRSCFVRQDAEPDHRGVHQFIQMLDTELQLADTYDNHKERLSAWIAKWLALYLCDAFRRIYGDDAITRVKQSEIAEWMSRLGTRALKNCQPPHTDRLTCPPESEKAALDALEEALSVEFETVTDRARRAIKKLRDWSTIKGRLADLQDIRFDWAGDRHPVPPCSVKCQPAAGILNINRSLLEELLKK